MIAAFAILLFVAGANADNRIVNGEEVTSTSVAPWQASLQQGGSHFCGGSLIDATHVMSACHCRKSFVNVVLGTLQYKNPKYELYSTDFKCHPSYNSRTIDYDYGIITLPEALPSNDADVSPITVANKEYSEGTNAQITGWGRLTGGGVIPDTLQVAYVNLIDRSTCQDTWTIVTERMQCAGGQGEGACNGDSGGPLAVKDNGVWVLVGNTSWGASGCSTGVPSAWSKNFAVYSWIQANSNISV